MTLQEATEAVLLRLNAGLPTADNMITDDMIAIEVMMQRDMMIAVEAKNLLDSSSQGEADHDLYILYGDSQATALTPDFDIFQNQYYMDLPTKPLNLKNRVGTFIGIDRIYPPGQKQNAYAMIERGMTELVPDVAMGLEGKMSWELSPAHEGKRVYFPNMTPSRKPDYLCVEMIPASQSDVLDIMGMTDKISIPARFTAVIIDKVVNVLLPRKGSVDSATDRVEEKK